MNKTKTREFILDISLHHFPAFKGFQLHPLLAGQVQSHEEEGQKKEKRTEGIDARVGDEQRPLVAGQVREGMPEGRLERGDQEVEIPPDYSDDKEVKGNCGCAYLGRGQVHHYGGGDSNPHLSDDVGGNETQEAPGVGQEQGACCKWSCQHLQQSQNQ